MRAAVLRIGTRGSHLALTQAGTIRDALVAAGAQAELVVVRTAGDASAAPVEQIGVGVFTAALREALVADEVDVAVHSYKDLPTAPDPRISLAAVPLREDSRDALVARDGLVLGELPTGARVGTSAPRRAAQLRALGLGFDVVPLRGNIDSRLAKVVDGQLDAVVLARAGLSRVGRLAEITESFDPVQMLPAPAQGALALECRVGDKDIARLLSTLEDSSSRATVEAERALLAALEAGCTAPVGAVAEVVESLTDDGRVIEEISLRACAAALDGSEVLRASGVGAVQDPQALGRAVAAELLELGARELVEAVLVEPQPSLESHP
ncbi:MAG: hydroxymethylbilane synthase [Actinomycetota bacterium]|nr:hydroxymethylbilane synthase [Actinomycetota bacterium]